MTIGNRICSLRKQKGFTQEYIADRLNVTRQAVSKWEQDQTSPDTWNLIELAKLLDTTVEYITLGEQETQLPPPTPTKTYCGKSCEDCEQKNILDCTGCKGGTQWNPQLRCEIAVCCNAKRFKSCNLCKEYCNCKTVRQNIKIPDRWLQKRKSEEELALLRIRIRKGSRIWIGILPFIATVYALTTYLLGDYAPISGTISGLSYGLCLFMLIPQADGYKTAGILLLFSTAIRLAGCYVPSPASTFFNLLFIIIRIIRMRSEFSGHEAISTHFDISIADTYSWLWRGYWIIPITGFLLYLLLYLCNLFVIAHIIGIGVIIADVILETVHICNLFKLRNVIFSEKTQ